MIEGILATRRLYCLLLSFVFVVQTGHVLAQAQLSPVLRDRLELSNSNEYLPVYVLLKSQANGMSLRKNLQAKGLSRAERNTAVIKSIRASNQASQRAIVEHLTQLPDVRNVRGRWLVNLVGFSASPASIRAIANHPDVEIVHLDAPWEFESSLEATAALVRPDGTEQGLRTIKAPALWKKGYTGFGSVGFTADTGVDPYHPALNHKYAGHEGRIGAWFDSKGTKNPFDCSNHGTHVTGTMLGLDRNVNDTIGVAPDAHWIGGAILCGIGTADNIEAFEWAIDPDGDLNTSDDRPIVINNSWHDPSITGTECSGQNPYPTILDNLQAVGIAVVFSAGNAGPNPRTITAPHNYNANITNAFTVGALNGNSLQIADFSSRGPSLCPKSDSSLTIKPEVSAPGQGVRSSVPGGRYGQLSGTSMAAPHTSGAVMLLHEAFPDLDGDSLLLSLYRSATDLGALGEDNTFGNGLINVEAAFDYLVTVGNLPATPARPNTAITVLSGEADDRQCGGVLLVTVEVLNSGTTTLTELAYQLKVNAQASQLGALTIDLAPGEKQFLTVSGASLLPGQSFVNFRITELNGQPADPRLDLGANYSVFLSQFDLPVVQMDRADESLCLGSPVHLRLNSTITDRSVTHFDEKKSLALFPATAKPYFVLDSLEEEITLYGFNEYQRDGGPSYATAKANLVFTNPVTTKLKMRPTADVTIRSLTLHAEKAGRILMTLKDDVAEEIVGRLLTTLAAGPNDLFLSFPMERGRTYTVEFTQSPALGYNPDERIENTQIADFVIITAVESSEMAIEKGSYFFFDWTVSYSDGCAPILVTLTPDTNRIALQRSIGIEGGTPTKNEVLTLRDTKLPTGTDYIWHAGQQTLPSDVSTALYTPTEEGSFQVLMSALDAAGCASGADTVLIAGPASNATQESPLAQILELWPNPSRDFFSLRGLKIDVQRVDLYDVQGRLVRTYSATLERYSIADIALGSYLVRVQYRDQSFESLALEVLK